MIFIPKIWFGQFTIRTDEPNEEIYILPPNAGAPIVAAMCSNDQAMLSIGYTFDSRETVIAGDATFTIPDVFSLIQGEQIFAQLPQGITALQAIVENTDDGFALIGVGSDKVVI